MVRNMSAPISSHAEDGIDVIIRFHDIDRLWELERAVFSLAGQEHRPIRALVVCQRFASAELEKVLGALAPVIAWAEGISVEVLNFDKPVPLDARSDLVNLGFASLRGRYVALLDYDDVLYPEAYRLLVAQLRASGAAIAFASTPVVNADVHAGFLHAKAMARPFSGQGLADLFERNFCPIHSYLMDRQRIRTELLRFEPLLAMEEDYAFLLTLCAAVRSDFSLLNKEVGLYFFKGDSSNTFARHQPLSDANLVRIDAAQYFNEALRRLTPLAPAVQESLGIFPPVAGLTIALYLQSLAATEA